MSIPDVLLPSPPTSSPLPSSSDSGSRKRVGFSLWTHMSPVASKTIPSRDGQTSVKSILKQCHDEPLAAEIGPQAPEDRADGALDSIIQQLAYGDRPTKVDAYSTLFSLLRAYDDVPNPVTLKSCLGALVEYIRRDVDIPTQSDAGNTTLVVSALKALVFLSWSPTAAPHITDEHRAWILEHSVQVIEEHTAPKRVMVHYLHLLGTQELRPVLVTSNNRACRLIEALSALSQHYAGNAITNERLIVYSRLLEQVRPHMQSNPSPWLRDLIHGLVSPIKDIRSRAIVLGTKVCSLCSSSDQVSATLRQILRTELCNGRSLSSYVRKRLESMIIAKSDSVQAPQIWSIIISLSGLQHGPKDQWSFLKEWLKVIQKAFNCGDSVTRGEAFLAWNRFVCVARPHEAPDALASVLMSPILAQFDREDFKDKRRSVHDLGVSTYCNLLYYAFRPLATSNETTRAWNRYIVKVMTSGFLRRSTRNADIACRVLQGLFGNPVSNHNIWHEHRVYDNARVTLEELPSLDPKWIRSKAGAIVEIVQLVLRYGSWGPRHHEALAALVWQGLCKAIADSCSREVKQSNETKQALQALIKLLEHINNAQDITLLSAESEAGEFTHRLQFLTCTLVKHVGVRAFIELLASEQIQLSSNLSNELLTQASEAASDNTATIGKLRGLLSLRPRHDDSQVTFVPVKPASVGGEEPLSQLLTERQKEVRNRQRQSSSLAAYFPDWASNAVVDTSRSSTSIKGLFREGFVAETEGRPSTPETRPEVDDQDVSPFIESPTPQSQCRGSGLEDMEIDSSPVRSQGSAEDVSGPYQKPTQEAADDHSGKRLREATIAQSVLERPPPLESILVDARGKVENESGAATAAEDDGPHGSVKDCESPKMVTAHQSEAEGCGIEMPTGLDIDRPMPTIEMEAVYDHAAATNRAFGWGLPEQNSQLAAMASAHVLEEYASQPLDDLHKMTETSAARETSCDRPAKRRRLSQDDYIELHTKASTPSEPDTADEDCIVVNTSPEDTGPEGECRTFTGSEAQPHRNTIIPPRKRGRPRKSTSQSSSQESSRPNLNCSQPSQIKLESELASCPSVNGAVEEVGVMQTLRHVLDLLKRAAPQEVDLRQVHDLCFDIRTEAQKAVERTC